MRINETDDLNLNVVIMFPCIGGRKIERGKLEKKTAKRTSKKNTFIIASAKIHVDVSITFICIFISNRLMLF